MKDGKERRGNRQGGERERRGNGGRRKGRVQVWIMGVKQ
jgi:hypothetical protein